MPSLRFVPSHTEGLPGAIEVAVYPDRLEIETSHGRVIHRFEDIAQWPWPAALWKRLARLGWRRRWLPVGERDWFHPPSERFFRFDTRPPLVIYLPDEDASLDTVASLFGRIRDLIRSGGYQTWDLG